MRHACLPSLNVGDYLSGELKSKMRHEYVNLECVGAALSLDEVCEYFPGQHAV